MGFQNLVRSLDFLPYSAGDGTQNAMNKSSVHIPRPIDECSCCILSRWKGATFLGLFCRDTNFIHEGHSYNLSIPHRTLLYEYHHLGDQVSTHELRGILVLFTVGVRTCLGRKQTRGGKVHFSSQFQTTAPEAGSHSRGNRKQLVNRRGQ